MKIILIETYTNIFRELVQDLILLKMNFNTLQNSRGKRDIHNSLKIERTLSMIIGSCKSKF